MLAQLLPLLALQAAPEIVTTGGRIPRPAPVEASATTATLGVRVEAAGEILWDGALRVATGQGASYQQHLNQASPRSCPPESQHDRSERRQLTVNVYGQQNKDTGESYRVDVSWQRPVPQEGCLESGTRTVQVTQAVPLAPGETRAIEGDAGLRVRLTRPR